MTRGNLPMRYRGFTLIELLLAVVLISLTIFGTASIIMRGLDIYGMARERREAVQAGRYATERMTREIRQIGNPATYVLIADGTTFRYITQLVPLTFVTYQISGNQLLRDGNLLVDHLAGANGFRYYNVAGQPAVGIVDISRMQITLNVDTGVPQYGSVPLQTDVYLRNRYYVGFSQP